MAALGKVTHIVVHYTATQRGKHVTVADIDKWHRDRGFAKIGYHFVIYLDGTVHKGRDETELGAHVGGKNTGKIGITWVGGVDGDVNKGVDTRTPAQTAALIRLINELLTRYPTAKVVGHRDLAATQCPGFDVIPWWTTVAGTRPTDTPTNVPAPPSVPQPAPSAGSEGSSPRPVPAPTGAAVTAEAWWVLALRRLWAFLSRPREAR